MEIKRTELKAALETVKPGLANKEIIQQSTSFAFMNGKVITYNDKISMSHPVKGLELEGAIKAEELYQLLGKLKAEKLQLEIKENEVIIKSAKSSAGLRLTEEILLPLDEITAIEKMQKLPEDFLEGIAIAVQSTSKDMSMAILTCVSVNGAEMDSSDNSRISRVILENEMPVDPFLLPNDVVPLILKMKATKIALTDSWVHFGNDEGTLLSARIFADIFPDLSKFFKMQKPIKIQLPEELAEMLDRAAVFSKREHFLDELVTIQIEPKKLKVKGESDTGWYAEVAKLKYEGEVISFEITPFVLQGILEKGKEMQYSSKQSMIKFETENWQYTAKVL